MKPIDLESSFDFISIQDEKMEVWKEMVVIEKRFESTIELDGKRINLLQWPNSCYVESPCRFIPVDELNCIA